MASKVADESEFAHQCPEMSLLIPLAGKLCALYFCRKILIWSLVWCWCVGYIAKSFVGLSVTKFLLQLIDFLAYFV